MTSRRNFLVGIATAVAAPAIVRAESLMAVARLRSSVVILPLPPSEHLVDLLAEIERVKQTIWAEYCVHKSFLIGHRSRRPYRSRSGEVKRAPACRCASP